MKISWSWTLAEFSAQNLAHCQSRGRELCESRGGRPGLPVPNEPYAGLCGCKAATSNTEMTARELSGGGGGRPGLAVPNSPYGLRGRNAALNLNRSSRAPERLKREVELSSHSWKHCLAAELILNSCCFGHCLCDCSAQKSKEQVAEYTSPQKPWVY